MIVAASSPTAISLPGRWRLILLVPALAACGSRSALDEPGAQAAGPAPSGTTSTSITGTSTSTSTPDVPEDCAVPDMDGDGHDALECGGDDCNDADAAVHPGAPDDAPGQWTVQTVHAGPGPFVSTALALTAAGDPRLAYLDDEAHRLRWAEPSGAGWQNEEIIVAWSGPTRSVSLVLDPGGIPHITYAGGGLRHATGGPGAWKAGLVDDAGGSYFATSVAAEGASLHVAYRQLSSIRYAHLDGAGWTTASLAPNGSAFGADVAIGVDASSVIHISYESVIGGMFGSTSLRYARNAGSGFEIEDVVDLPAGAGQTYGALAVAPDGLARIAYRDGSQKALRLATRTPGAWSHETVDASDDAGAHASIALDAAGAVHVAYRAQGPGDLRHATNAGGAWVVETVDASADGGLFTSMKIDPEGHVHIGYVTVAPAEVRHATNAEVADGLDQDCDGEDG